MKRSQVTFLLLFCWLPLTAAAGIVKEKKDNGEGGK